MAVMPSNHPGNTEEWPQAALLLPGALLVAVRAQLLAALVLVNLRLTTFLQRSHTVVRLSCPVFNSIHDLIERILNDPFRSGSLQ